MPRRAGSERAHQFTANSPVRSTEGSGEEATFSSDQMAAMLELAKKGATEIVELQKAAIAAADQPDTDSLANLAAAFGQ